MPTTNEVVWSREELLEIATRQKQILLLILLSLLTLFIPYARFLVGFVQIYFIYKYARALRSSMAWVYIILAFIPLAGLLGLLHLNSKGTKALQANGIRVGLMGAGSADIEALKTAAV
jgi:hypothetical protein